MHSISSFKKLVCETQKMCSLCDVIKLQNSCRTHINGDIEIVSLELERNSYIEAHFVDINDINHPSYVIHQRSCDKLLRKVDE